VKFSIITLSLNSSKTILETIQSVNSQDYTDIEHILIDGKSEDETLKIFHENVTREFTVISEKDNGIYDAMNKGISLAKGDVIGFLHSDDILTSKNSISNIANAFRQHDVDLVYSDLHYVKRKNPKYIVRVWTSSIFRAGNFAKGWNPPHPTFYVRKNIYYKYGLYDVSYKIAADIEFMARMLEVHKLKSIYLPKTLIKMKLGGLSNRSWTNTILLNREIIAALKRHNLYKGIITYIIYKLVNRSIQFIRGFVLNRS
jgi:glycosyltransferase